MLIVGHHCTLWINTKCIACKADQVYFVLFPVGPVVLRFKIRYSGMFLVGPEDRLPLDVDPPDRLFLHPQL